MMLAVDSARTAGLDRIRSGLSLRARRRRAISGASCWPRRSRTRSQSCWPGSDVSAFACRTSVSRLSFAGHLDETVHHPRRVASHGLVGGRRQCLAGAQAEARAVARADDLVILRPRRRRDRRRRACRRPRSRRTRRRCCRRRRRRRRLRPRRSRPAVSKRRERRGPSSHHARLQLRGLRHHRLVPRRVEHQFDVGLASRSGSCSTFSLHVLRPARRPCRSRARSASSCTSTRACHRRRA